MSIEKEFVPYTESLELKELGFDEPCLAYYNKKELFSFAQVCNEPIKGHYIKMSNRLCTPTFSQAFRWFREKHKLFAPVTTNGLGQYDFRIGLEWSGRIWDTYEEAELACLDKLIEIVKTK